MVTANISLVVRDSPDLGPSFSEPLMCWWGTTMSSTSRNAMPAIKPAAAGTTRRKLPSGPLSMAGISSDHTDAATITPAAKPVSSLLSMSGILRRMENTQAAPKVVPARGRSNPKVSPSIVRGCMKLYAKVIHYNTFRFEIFGFLRKKCYLCAAF